MVPHGRLGSPLDMKYRPIGASGLVASVIGLGCTSFGKRMTDHAAYDVVAAAFDGGVTYFDTSDIYGGGRSEEVLASALGQRRDQVVIATKFGARRAPRADAEWSARGSRRYVLRAVEASLRRLKTDYIDLYQIHEPDLTTPIAETLEVLNDLRTAGKIRYVGCSNFSAWQLTDAHWTARTQGWASLISAQNEYSLLRREAEEELLPACRHLGVGFIPYFPLAAGLLTGKYSAGISPTTGRLAEPGYAHLLDPQNLDVVTRLRLFAENRGRSVVELAIAALVAQPGVATVIAGASTPEQLQSNLHAVDWELTAEDLISLETSFQPKKPPSSIPPIYRS